MDSLVTAATSTGNWETELGALLERLSAAQQELLALLTTKRELIVLRDHAALASLAIREARLGDELRACHADRQRLLAQADADGLPRQSLADLSAALPRSAAQRLDPPIAEARRRAQLIRHECLAQWVTMQRTVLHLSQMLEIIATGGRSQPTYGKGGGLETSGALMDQAV
jgi:FlgN protein